MNGIQTLSSSTLNLINNLEQMKEIGVDIIRISPQSEHSDNIIDIFRDVIDNKVSSADAQSIIDKLISQKQCNGYWFEQAGMDMVELAQSMQ